MGENIAQARLVLGTAFWIPFICVALAVGPRTGSSEPLTFRACVDVNVSDTTFFLPVAMAAGFYSAERHITAGDCTYMDHICEDLLPIELEVSVMNLPLQHDDFSSAVAALECSTDFGGDMVFLGPDSKSKTLVPINAASGLVSAAAALSQSPSDSSRVFRTHLTGEADDILSLAHYWGWSKISVLYDELDSDFASTVVADAPLFEVEAASFSFSEDFTSKIPSIFEFGSSVIVVPSSLDISGSTAYLLKALAEAEAGGLLGPEFTWIGVHRMSRAHFDTQHDPLGTGTISLLAQLTEEMIFVKSLPLVSPRAYSLWEEVSAREGERLRSAFPTLNLEKKQQRVFSDYFTEFAMAYDSMWLFASAFSRGAAASNSSESWHSVIESVEIHGALSDMWVDSAPGHEEMPHEVQIFTIGEENRHEILAHYYVHSRSLTFQEGHSQIPWRDGTFYPESMPKGELPKYTDGAPAYLWTIVGVACFTLLLCVAFFIGFLHLRRTLNKISHTSRLDVESPLSKAVEMLQELSTAFMVSRSMRERAVNIYTSLLNAQDVHAPDLEGQEVNPDMMQYLNFQSERPAERPNSRAHPFKSFRRVKRPSLTSTECPDPEARLQRILSEPREVDVSLSSFDCLPPLPQAGVDLFFNTFEAASATANRPLLAVSMSAIRNLDLIDGCELNEEGLAAFIASIEEGYNNVPYHNSTHAADVVSRVCAILRADEILTDGSEESNSLLLAVVLAAIVHDYLHPGLSNAFQVTADSDVSHEFNEQHVLEMASLNRSLGILRSGTFELFQTPSKRRMRSLCSDIIHLVLATDMSRHFEILSAFKGKFCKLQVVRPQAPRRLVRNSAAGENQAARTHSSFGSMHSTVSNASLNSPMPRRKASLTGATAVNQVDMDSVSRKDRQLILQMALKIADVGHMAAPFEQHQEWSQRLENEFLAQGDLEKSMGFIVSPLMDREKPSVTHPDNQVAFADVIVMPMLDAWQKTFPLAGMKLHTQALSNRLHWQSEANSNKLRSVSFKGAR